MCELGGNYDNGVGLVLNHIIFHSSRSMSHRTIIKTVLETRHLIEVFECH